MFYKHVYPSFTSERSYRRRLNTEGILAMMVSENNDDGAIRGGSDGDSSESDSNKDTVINGDYAEEEAVRDATTS